MATYLAKIDQFPLPTVGGRGWFSAPKKASELPERGDELFIWTNETPDQRNVPKEKGVGLAALGIVAHAERQATDTDFLIEFDLLARVVSPLGNNDWDTSEGLASLLVPFRNYTLQRITPIDDRVAAAFLRSRFLQN